VFNNNIIILLLHISKSLVNENNGLSCRSDFLFYVRLW
jgi:hypothetical protein